jgi:hypothetical protein
MRLIESSSEKKRTKGGIAAGFRRSRARRPPRRSDCHRLGGRALRPYGVIEAEG